MKTMAYVIETFATEPNVVLFNSKKSQAQKLSFVGRS